MARFTVIGPGALGILFSVMLHDASQDVSVLDYREERAHFLNANGLRLLEKDRVIDAHPLVATKVEPLVPADFVLVLVKAHQTRSVIPVVRTLCSSETIVLSLQNGIGAADILGEAVPAENIFLGTTTHGANLVSPGVVRHAGSGPTVIGPHHPDSSSMHRLDELAEIFNKAGFNTSVVKDIYPYLWRKLLVNVGINPLTALTGLRNGALLDFPQTRRLQEMAVAEAFGIVKASDIDLGMDISEVLEMVREVCVKTGENISSMLQDRLNGRPTEIGFITGAVAEKALRLGMSAPVNEMLTQLVEFHSRAGWGQFSGLFELADKDVASSRAG